MSKTKNSRLKAPEIQAPQTLEEAEAVLARVGESSRQLEILQARMNDRLERIKAEYHERAAPHQQAIQADFQALQAYAEANRADLLEKGRKSRRLTTGELGWRTSPPAVRLAGVQKVLEALRSLGLTRFIRTKEEVNKERILEEPDAVAHVKGISIVRPESFWVKPAETEIEIDLRASRKVG